MRETSSSDITRSHSAASPDALLELAVDDVACRRDHISLRSPRVGVKSHFVRHFILSVPCAEVSRMLSLRRTCNVFAGKREHLHTWQQFLPLSRLVGSTPFSTASAALFSYYLDALFQIFSKGLGPQLRCGIYSWGTKVDDRGVASRSPPYTYFRRPPARALQRDGPS
jgi:hypothetical protein